MTSPTGTPTSRVGDFILDQRIGSGSFATVYKAHYSPPPSSPYSQSLAQSPSFSKGIWKNVAIKSVDKNRLDKRLSDNLESEIRILRTLRHENVVALYHVHPTPTQMHLIMEYCDLGDLSDYIKGREGKDYQGRWGLKLNVSLWFLGQIASAFQFLRLHNLIHRDLKPQNLLLSSRSDLELPLLKLADFGFARLLPTASLASTLCGSPLYMAPEILRHEKYDAKADLWSVGVVLFEMLAGRVPFRARNHVELLKKIEAGQRLKWPDEREREKGGIVEMIDEIPLDVKDLVHGLLQRNNKERMDFQHFFNAPPVKASAGFKPIFDVVVEEEPLVQSESSISSDEDRGLKSLVKPLEKPKGVVIVTDKGVSTRPLYDLPTVRGTDGDEYVVISKKALEVDWLIDQVETRLHTRSTSYSDRQEDFGKLDGILSRATSLMKLADGHYIHLPPQKRFPLYIKCLGMYQKASELAKSLFDDVSRLAPRIQTLKSGFHHCLEQAHRVGESDLSPEKIVYECVLDLARDGALKELGSTPGSVSSETGKTPPKDGRESEVLYNLGIQLLEALLDDDDEEEDVLGPLEGIKFSDRRVLEELLSSLRARLAAVRRKSVGIVQRVMLPR